MVRTSFCFDDDKELVQLARGYEQDGARISWRDVAHRMRHTRHNANALHQRLKSLMRTHGSRLAQFPRNYYTPVQRPRGVAALPSPPRPSELSNPNQAVQSVVQAAPSWIPPLSPTSAEHVVAAIFDDVPRQMILGYEGDSIHKNVGEVMPSGVTMLLAELGNIDGQDVFLDIGSGLGNIVAQVVLATDVYRVMGIEAREEVQRAGIDAINRSSYAWAFRERAPFISKDVSDIRLATNSPFAEATVVYWNNVLFEPRVVEHVKNELCTMANIRYLLSCVNFCPRHRPLCLSGFCASLDLMKVVGVPCSWKAKPQSVYIYKSKQNE
ncbi:Histone methylation protein [Phytophthora palmivora]|uniref:Histone methylation protein n=1 Tax=Phytophthora palmivora TaxID=4796 RepID=A0A2P4YEL9_9STRA|nr:Histone methylation protein [Phytophthora palmivora]